MIGVGISTDEARRTTYCESDIISIAAVTTEPGSVSSRVVIEFGTCFVDFFVVFIEE